MSIYAWLVTTEGSEEVVDVDVELPLRETVTVAVDVNVEVVVTVAVLTEVVLVTVTVVTGSQGSPFCVVDCARARIASASAVQVKDRILLLYGPRSRGRRPFHPSQQLIT